MSATADTIHKRAPKRRRQTDALIHPDTQFVATASDRLRTPAHTIIGHTQLLLDGVYGPLTDEQEQTMLSVRERAGELLSLVDNLLDVPRIENGHADLFLSTFDMRDLFTDLLTQFRPLAAARHTGLESKVLADHPTVRTDRAKLRHVLASLIDDAINSSEQGRINLTLSPAPASNADPHAGQRLLITVQSTGAKVAGTDSEFGLQINRQLLDLLGATLETHSADGQGTATTMSIPKSFDEVAAIHRLRDRLAGNGTASPEKLLVLVVSDKADFAPTFQTRLGDASFVVRTTVAGNEAVHLARKLRPLVTVLDAESTSSDFWAVYQELKSHPDTKDIPTMFLGSDNASSHSVPTTAGARASL